jgi:serine/threonine protein kinase
MGLGLKSSVVYVIDFGLSKPYYDTNGSHIPYKSNKNLTGTARYTSINNHRGVEQSRRDDLEGALYVLLYFLRGSLPWQGLPAQNRREKYKRILDVKIVTTPESLCKGFPRQLKDLLRYCRGLKFEETPNYKYIKDRLYEIATENGFTFDNLFDWTINTSKEETKVVPNIIVKKENGEQLSLQTQKNSQSAPKAPSKPLHKHPEYELVVKCRKKNINKGAKGDGACLVL